MPFEVSTVIICPVFNFERALPVPTTAGMPSSRETIAAWEVRPPFSVIIAEAIFIIGSQSGSVISVTKISPFWNSSNFLTSVIIRTLPLAILVPTAIPTTIGSCLPAGRFLTSKEYSVMLLCFFSD